jgi:hypothetical protein
MIKIMKDGCRTIMTEFEVRQLDKSGDALDVYYYETKQEALADATKLMQRGAVAVIVEKHITRSPSSYWREADTYQPVARLGDEAAIASGNWAQ